MKKLLLHSCCGPCSTVVIELLSKEYEITVFYYNPNIEPILEYEKRKAEQIRFIKEYNPNIKIIIGEYENAAYHNKIANYENLKEKSRRCFECMDLRISKTAKYAKDNGFDLFETTLSVSPHKNSEWIIEIAKKWAAEYNIEYINGNYKKNDGYKRSIELANKYELYRQNYCGCSMSLNNL